MKEYRLDRSFNLSFCYVDHVSSLNNHTFGDLIHRIYQKLEIKDTTDTGKPASSSLDLYLEING